MSTHLAENPISPVELLRDITGRAARGEPFLDPRDQPLLRERGSAHQTGIVAVWLGTDQANRGYGELQPRCQHSMESVATYIQRMPSEFGFHTHAQASARGIRGRIVRTGFEPGLIRCACCPYGTYRDLPPISVNLVDRRIALIRTTAQGDDPSVIAVTDRTVVENVGRYVDRVTEVSTPDFSDWVRPLDISRRQLKILALMAAGHTDDKIAEALAKSSRTVRAEVATLYEMFGAHSRFELGAAYMTWVRGG